MFPYQPQGRDIKGLYTRTMGHWVGLKTVPTEWTEEEPKWDERIS